MNYDANYYVKLWIDNGSEAFYNEVMSAAKRLHLMLHNGQLGKKNPVKELAKELRTIVTKWKRALPNMRQDLRGFTANQYKWEELAKEYFEEADASAHKVSGRRKSKIKAKPAAAAKGPGTTLRKPKAKARSKSGSGSLARL